MDRVPPVLTKNAYVYEQVRRRIMSGELAQGQTIQQAQLAAELGVSTTPMREALRRLGAEGLVTIDAHRDARVATLTAAEAQNLAEVRENLDPLAAMLAATRRTDADSARILTAASQLQPLAGEPSLAALEAHRAFHRAVYAASHNELLVGLLEGLWDKADRYRAVGLATERDSAAERERVQTEHTRIAAAVIAGDVAEAQAVMLRHVGRSLVRRAIDELD
ncbi:GntR family transcriptional regulator [Actinoplanes sp. NPDC051411]|uniref:GntR family transcriptional regulator n=1 Tax=Actinoplanes sp. NPDC051411 TaxID=3155522 RepID=UPI00342CF3E4